MSWYDIFWAWPPHLSKAAVSVEDQCLERGQGDSWIRVHQLNSYNVPGAVLNPSHTLSHVAHAYCYSNNVPT